MLKNQTINQKIISNKVNNKDLCEKLINSIYKKLLDDFKDNSQFTKIIKEQMTECDRVIKGLSYSEYLIPYIKSYDIPFDIS